MKLLARRGCSTPRHVRVAEVALGRHQGSSKSHVIGIVTAVPLAFTPSILFLG